MSERSNIYIYIFPVHTWWIVCCARSYSNELEEFHTDTVQDSGQSDLVLLVSKLSYECDFPCHVVLQNSASIDRQNPSTFYPNTLCAYHDLCLCNSCIIGCCVNPTIFQGGAQRRIVSPEFIAHRPVLTNWIRLFVPLLFLTINKRGQIAGWLEKIRSIWMLTTKKNQK